MNKQTESLKSNHIPWRNPRSHFACQLKCLHLLSEHQLNMKQEMLHSQSQTEELTMDRCIQSLLIDLVSVAVNSAVCPCVALHFSDRHLAREEIYE